MKNRLSFYRNGFQEFIEVMDFAHAINLWRMIKYEERDDVYDPWYHYVSGSKERIWDNS
ncbi:MAG TPA: hypothetical protein VMV77_02290 [Bacteroidales bacterium]|nr:hypothetical protein [Bacteroidales bacterium]